MPEQRQFVRDRKAIASELRAAIRSRKFRCVEVSVIGCTACNELDGTRHALADALRDMPLPNSRCLNARCYCVYVYIFNDET